MKIIRSWIDRALTESEEERETSTVGTAGAEREILGVWEGGGGEERDTRTVVEVLTSQPLNLGEENEKN